MNLRKEWYEQELIKSEEAVAHRSLEEEYSFYHAVSSGDMDFVQENCRQDTFTNPEGMGILFYKQLNKLKISFCYYCSYDYKTVCNSRNGIRTGLPFK